MQRGFEHTSTEGTTHTAMRCYPRLLHRVWVTFPPRFPAAIEPRGSRIRCASHTQYNMCPNAKRLRLAGLLSKAVFPQDPPG